MSDFLITATEDMTREALQRDLEAAFIQAEPVWEFISMATSMGEYEDRKALVEDRFKQLDDTLRSRVEAKFDKDFLRMAAASFDIVAYDYNADRYCPDHIMDAMGLSQGLIQQASKSVEDILDQVAEEKGIDRYDESSYDSSEFPKVVFRDQISGYDTCAYGHQIEASKKTATQYMRYQKVVTEDGRDDGAITNIQHRNGEILYTVTFEDGSWDVYRGIELAPVEPIDFVGGPSFSAGKKTARPEGEGDIVQIVGHESGGFVASIWPEGTPASFITDVFPTREEAQAAADAYLQRFYAKRGSKQGRPFGKTASAPMDEEAWGATITSGQQVEWNYDDAPYSYTILEGVKGNTYLWTVWEFGHSVEEGEADSWEGAARAINAWLPVNRDQMQMSFAKKAYAKLGMAVQDVQAADMLKDASDEELRFMLQMAVFDGSQGNAESQRVEEWIRREMRERGLEHRAKKGAWTDLPRKGDTVVDGIQGIDGSTFKIVEYRGDFGGGYGVEDQNGNVAPFPALADSPHDAALQLFDMKLISRDVYRGLVDSGKLSRKVASKRYEIAKKVVDTKTAGELPGGILLDLFTASAITQVYENLSSENQAKFDDIPLDKLVAFVMSHVSVKKDAGWTYETLNDRTVYLYEDRNNQATVEEDGTWFFEVGFSGDEVYTGKERDKDAAVAKVEQLAQQHNSIAKKSNLFDNPESATRDGRDEYYIMDSDALLVGGGNGVLVVNGWENALAEVEKWNKAYPNRRHHPVAANDMNGRRPVIWMDSNGLMGWRPNWF